MQTPESCLHVDERIDILSVFFTSLAAWLIFWILSLVIEVVIATVIVGLICFPDYVGPKLFSFL